MRNRVLADGNTGLYAMVSGCSGSRRNSPTTQQFWMVLWQRDLFARTFFTYPLRKLFRTRAITAPALWPPVALLYPKLLPETTSELDPARTRECCFWCPACRCPAALFSQLCHAWFDPECKSLSLHRCQRLKHQGVDFFSGLLRPKFALLQEMEQGLNLLPNGSLMMDEIVFLHFLWQN